MTYKVYQGQIKIAKSLVMFVKKRTIISIRVVGYFISNAMCWNYEQTFDVIFHNTLNPICICKQYLRRPGLLIRKRCYLGKSQANSCSCQTLMKSLKFKNSSESSKSSEIWTNISFASSLTTVKEHCALGMNSCKAHTSSPEMSACHLFAVKCWCENSQVRAHEIKFPLKGMKAGFGHLYLFTTLSCRLSNCFFCCCCLCHLCVRSDAVTTLKKWRMG